MRVERTKKEVKYTITLTEEEAEKLSKLLGEMSRKRVEELGMPGDYNIFYLGLYLTLSTSLEEE